MDTKTCKRCSTEKPVTDFYVTSGFTCKVCIREGVRIRRADKIDEIREYDRNRPNQAARAVLNKENYRRRISTPEGRAREWARAAAQRKGNSKKRGVNVFISNAIRDGRVIVRPCERCTSEHKVQAHHEDYDKPLDITWLCRPCHGQRHREINAERRGAAP